MIYKRYGKRVQEEKGKESVPASSMEAKVQQEGNKTVQRDAALIVFREFHLTPRYRHSKEGILERGVRLLPPIKRARSRDRVYATGGARTKKFRPSSTEII